MISTFAVLLAAAVAQANPSLPPLVSVDDYPPEAIERDEQGAVQTLLQVGIDGRVKACDVIVSSNSQSLDAKTCQIMLERARFSPPRDENGKATEGEFTMLPIRWVLSGPGAPEPTAIVKQAPGRKIVCEAGPGEYTTVAVPGAQDLEMAVNVRLVEAKPHVRWIPTAGIVFKVKGKDTSVGAQVIMDPAKPDELRVGLRLPSNDRLRTFKRVPSDAPVPISARMQGSILIGSSGTQLEASKLTEQVEAPELMCSSGRFEFQL